MTIFCFRLAANEFSRASTAAACSDLLEEPPSSLFPTLQQPPHQKKTSTFMRTLILWCALDIKFS